MAILGFKGDLPVFDEFLPGQTTRVHLVLVGGIGGWGRREERG